MSAQKSPPRSQNGGTQPPLTKTPSPPAKTTTPPPATHGRSQSDDSKARTQQAGEGQDKVVEESDSDSDDEDDNRLEELNRERRLENLEQERKLEEKKKNEYKSTPKTRPQYDTTSHLNSRGQVVNELSNAPVKRSTKYVTVRDVGDGKEITQINEAGMITKHNYSDYGYAFATAEDITGRMDRRAVKTGSEPNPYKIATRRVSLEYQDKSITQSALFGGCVIQNRDDINKESGQKYGMESLTVGIPTLYVRHMFTCASAAGITVGNKDNVRENDGYYWYYFDIKTLQPKDIGINIAGNHAHVGVRDVLEGAGSNVTCDIVVTLSISHTVSKGDTGFNINNGRYTPSFKLANILFRGMSSVEAPKFIPNTKALYGTQRTEKSNADPEFVRRIFGELSTDD